MNPFTLPPPLLSVFYHLFYSFLPSVFCCSSSAVLPCVVGLIFLQFHGCCSLPAPPSPPWSLDIPLFTPRAVVSPVFQREVSHGPLALGQWQYVSPRCCMRPVFKSTKIPKQPLPTFSLLSVFFLFFFGFLFRIVSVLSF